MSMSGTHERHCSLAAKASPGRNVSTKSWTLDCSFSDCSIIKSGSPQCLEGIVWFARRALHPDGVFVDDKGVSHKLSKEIKLKGTVAEMLLHVFKLLMHIDCRMGKECVANIFPYINNEIEHCTGTGYLPPEFITSCLDVNVERSTVALTLTYYADFVSFQGELYCWDLATIESKIDAFEQDFMEEVFAILHDDEVQ